MEEESVNSGNLLILVRNLDKSEVRNFSLHASRYDLGHEKNYMRLFNVIRKEQVVSEGMFSAHPELHSFSNNINYEKHRLFELILESLVSRYTRKTPLHEIISELQKIDILRTKRLYQAGLSRLKKIKKEASEKECFEELLLIIDKEIQFQYLIDNGANEFLQKLSSERSKILKTLMRIESIQKLRLEMITILAHKGSPRDNSKRQEFNFFHKKIQAWMNEKSLPVTIKDELYRTAICFHKLVLEYDETYRYNILRNELFIQHKFLIEKNPEVYIQFLYLFAMNNFSVGRTNEGLKNFDALKKYKNTLDSRKDSHLYAYIELRIVPLEMYIYCVTENYQEIERNEARYKKFIDDHSHELSISRKSAFCYNLAQAYFIARKYDKAKFWINIILNCSRNKIEFELFFYPMLMLIIVCFEKGEENIAESMIRSLERYLGLKEGPKFIFERELLKCIKKVISAEDFAANQIKRDFVSGIKEKGMKLEQHPFLDEWLFCR